MSMGDCNFNHHKLYRPITNFDNIHAANICHVTKMEKPPKSHGTIPCIHNNMLIAELEKNNIPIPKDCNKCEFLWVEMEPLIDLYRKFDHDAHRQHAYLPAWTARPATNYGNQGCIDLSDPKYNNFDNLYVSGTNASSMMFFDNKWWSILGIYKSKVSNVDKICLHNFKVEYDQENFSKLKDRILDFKFEDPQWGK